MDEGDLAVGAGRSAWGKALSAQGTSWGGEVLSPALTLQPKLTLPPRSLTASASLLFHLVWRMSWDCLGLYAYICSCPCSF